MKIFDIAQLAEADRVTVKKQAITFQDLMERASRLVFEEIDSRLKGSQVPIKIFCGIGNNGGDGLVIGRLLMEHGYNVSVYVVNYSNKRAEDFLKSYDRIKEVGKWPTLLKSKEDFPALESKDFVVDAIFGIGLNRPLEDWVADLVKYINNSGAFIISVDMPSGLFSEKLSKDKDAVIKANYTISFQAPKLVFFLPETAHYVGDLQVIDIGLDREFLQKAPARAHLIDKNEAIRLYIPRRNFDHKGNYGHTLVVGGSYGKIGSISLSGTAALRAGAGMVTFFAPQCGYQILQTVLPEAMVITDPSEKELSNIKFDFEPDVICFGMGAGTSEVAIEAFKSLLQKTKKPMVIDADGLNMLSKKKELLALVPENSVLTPHPKELERLLGKWKNDFDKLKKAKQFSLDHNIVLVIKGAHTMTIYKEEMYVNNTGNPGMATAGAGDVLAGVIAGLISQGYEPLIAAVFGVYLHGKAGDIAANSLSYQGLIAGDIANNIGAAFIDLFKNSVEPT